MYTGITKDVARRINEHNHDNQKSARYTRARRPVTLVYEEEIKSKSIAYKREYQIKQLSRVDKLVLIRSCHNLINQVNQAS